LVHTFQGSQCIIGTAAYMSPEQARGRGVDKRTDVWAFGCVLYEALTGHPAFAGETVADIIAAIVKAEPDWSRLPAGTPSTVCSLLRQCLQKQPRRRLQEIAGARVAIEDALREPVSAVERGPDPRRSIRRPMIPIFGAVLIIGALMGWLATRTSPVLPRLAHLQMSVQPADQLAATVGTWSARPSRTAFALSPDGQLVVFSGRSVGRPPQTQLYARELAKPEAAPIPGTEGGTSPFFSPDGQWIGFLAQNQIRKVPVAGGPPVIISDVMTGAGLFGASWGEDGTILFSESPAGITKVPASGGKPVTVTTAKGEQHLLPQLLPGGKAMLFTIQSRYDWDRAQVVLQSLETQVRRVLIQGGANARYVATGHLLYMKSGTLMAVPFDVAKLQVTGDPVALLEDVMQAVNTPNSNDETGAGQFVVSSSGTLAYVPGGLHPNRDSALVWVDRKGKAQPLFTAP
jgi:serine/threonine-protein kinase